jgi:hypothetical protein
MGGDTAPLPKPAPDWELYRALREQWTHEDNLVNHRLMWLILFEGLLFTAYGTLSSAKLHWLVVGFPFFGTQGRLAAQALPFVFGALWLLALAGAFGS